MAGQSTPRKGPPSPNGAPTLTPLGHYAGRADIALSRQVTVVGSKTGSRLHLASSTVSKSHALIVNSSAGPYIRDLASRTHVIVNGKPQREADLYDGVLLQIGKFKFQFNEGLAGAGVQPGRSAPVGGFDPAPGAVLNVEGGEMPIPIDDRSMIIGRRPTCDVPLIEDSVSTAHAVIFEMNGKRFIRDLDSRTGTLVNGTPVDQVELKFGDEIRIGDTKVIYNAASVATDTEVDELDHLVSTAPLGTAALEMPQLAGDADEADEADDEGHDASAISADESEHGQAAAAASVAPSPSIPTRPLPDHVDLATDPDVAGPGPGDTAVLPAERVEPRKAPTLKATRADEESIEVAPPAAPNQGADIDDVLGLTPEARRREQANAEDLGGSRRGWRGMSGDEISLPLGDAAVSVPPPAAPQPPPSALEPEDLVDEEVPVEVEDDAAADEQVVAEAPAPTIDEPAVEELVAEEALQDEIPSLDDLASAAAEAPVDGEAPVEPAEELAADEAPADDALEVAAVDEAPADDALEAAAVDEAPVDDVLEIAAVDESPAVAPVPAARKEEPQTPAHVQVGEEVEPVDTLPAETFEMESEVDELVLADEPAIPPELHLPPVIDETLVSDDVLATDAEIDLAPPLDLSLDGVPGEDDVEPVLDLSGEAPEAPTLKEDAVDIAPLAASRTDTPSSAKPQAAKPAPAPEPVAAEPELEAEPAKKAKRKRAARKRKDEVVEPVAEAPEPEPVVAPEPEPEPVAASPQPVVEPTPEPAIAHEPELDAFAPPLEELADAPRDVVEVLDETQPTPESALDIEDAVADMLSEPLSIDDTIEAPGASDMTDTGFGRAVEAFSGESSTGPLVEAREEPEPKAKADVERVAEADIEAGTSVEEAKAIDDLIADALMGGAVTVGGAQAAADEAEAEAVAELDKAIEEAAAAAAAPTDAESEIDLESIEALEASTLAETEAKAEDDLEPIAGASEAETEEEKAESAEPVARADDVPPEEPSEARPAAAESKPSADGKAGPGAPPSPSTWGPNQEHFLGGMPLKLNKPVEPAPIGRVGVTFDKPAAAARAPEAASPGTPQQPPRQKPQFMPTPPPRATRPNARTRQSSSPFDISPADVPPVRDAGASIPPYAGNSPKAGQITTGFDGLAMPPVRQTDVFSQMTTPAAFVNGLAGSGSEEDDIFGRGARMAARQDADHSQPQQQQQQQQRQQQAEAGDGSGGEGRGAPKADEIPSPADAVWADEPNHEDAQETVAAAGAPRRAQRSTLPPAFPVNEDAPPAPAKRKRRWFGLRLLLVLMLLCGIGAAAGIYGFVGKQTNVLGLLKFNNFPIKTIEQQNLLEEQRTMLADQTLRESARKTLAQRNPDIAPGFLADAVAYEQAAKEADWSRDGAKGTLAFPYGGRDEHGDGPRVRAVMLALYDANAKHAGDSGKLRAAIDALTDAHRKSQARVADLKAQIDRLGAVAQQMPDRKTMEALTGEVAHLDRAYNDARRKVMDLNLELEGMRKGLPANPQPAGTAQAPVIDPELAKLQDELAAAQAKLAESKTGRAKAAEEARAALDEALDGFQKQITSAQSGAAGNPELSAYVAAASKLQTSTRELTDQLIRRQQEQQQQLTELKTKLAEKMELRRADAWKKDPKLQELSDQLAIVQRQYSAAMGGGAQKEAEEFKSQISLLDQMIKARQTLVADDAFYADAINQLQKFIDAGQRTLNDDRKRTEGVLEEMQASFTASQPAVEKMPEAQKELAASLEKQLADINVARRKYTLAADTAAAAGDEELKDREAAASALAAKIAERRKDLAAGAAKAEEAQQEQQRIAALKKREGDLVAAQTAENATRESWSAAQRKLREAQSIESEAREAGEKRDALAAERDTAQKELEAQLRQLELNRAKAARTVAPVPPTDADVKMTIHDPRPVYALASVGGIVALFTLLILFTSPGASADALDDDEPLVPIADLALAAATPRPLPTPMPQAVDANGNGNASAHADHDDAEETPSRLAI